jgi:hypothetical protein
MPSDVVKTNQLERERKALIAIQRGEMTFRAHFGYKLDAEDERVIVDFLLPVVRRQILKNLFREQTLQCPFLYPESMTFEEWLASAEGKK